MSKRPSPPIESRWSRPLGTDARLDGGCRRQRQGNNARQLLESVAPETGDEGIAISVLTVLELAHGITRAADRASALELGYGVTTANVRHFQLIPGLNVIQL